MYSRYSSLIVWLVLSFFACVFSNFIYASSDKTKTGKTDLKGSVAIPVKNPFKLPQRGILKSRSVSGDVLEVIDDDDFIFPALSPDGRFLAFAQKKYVNDKMVQKLFISDLMTCKRHLFFTSTSAKEHGLPEYFGNYFPDCIDWKNGNIVVDFYDGDVDGIELTFDEKERKIIRIKETSFLDYEVAHAPLSKQNQKTKRHILQFFSDILEEQAISIVENMKCVTGENCIIMEKPVRSGTTDIWFLEIGKNTKKILISSVKEETLVSGVIFSDSGAMLFLAEESWDKIDLFLYGKNNIQRVNNFDVYKRWSFYPVVVYRSKNYTLFQLKLFPVYKKGDSPLFLYANNDIFRVTDYENLIDVDVDENGRIIVFNYWGANGDRHLVVKELKPGL